MNRSAALRIFALTIGGLLAAACGEDLPTEASPGSVTVVSPADGATVSSPVLFEFTPESFEVVPADGTVKTGQAHMHILVGVGCIEPGEIIIGPDDEHIHWGDGALSKEVELPSGTHELCIQPGSGNHAALPITETLTITVE